jgi:hypothetical protein
MSRLAQALVRECERGDLEPETVRLAVAPFVARPAASTYVEAVRALRQARRAAKVDKVLAEHRRRERERAIGLLRSVGASGDRLAATLGRGAPDRRAAARVHALACLLGAYEELEARSQLERDAWRKRLGFDR